MYLNRRLSCQNTSFCVPRIWPGTHGLQDAPTDLIYPLSNVGSEECFLFVLIFANYPFLSKKYHPKNSE